MTIKYCDRCGVELIFGKQSGAIHGISDADADKSGSVTDGIEVCMLCYREFKAWVKGGRMIDRAGKARPPLLKGKEVHDGQG